MILPLNENGLRSSDESRASEPQHSAQRVGTGEDLATGYIFKGICEKTTETSTVSDQIRNPVYEESGTKPGSILPDLHPTMRPSEKPLIGAEHNTRGRIQCAPYIAESAVGRVYMRQQRSE